MKLHSSRLSGPAWRAPGSAQFLCQICKRLIGIDNPLADSLDFRSLLDDERRELAFTVEQTALGQQSPIEGYQFLLSQLGQIFGAGDFGTGSAERVTPVLLRSSTDGCFAG
jgi:hypothetical protein